MKYTDTRDKKVSVDFRTAVLNGMNAETGGLYMPTDFPHLENSFLERNSAKLPTKWQSLMLKMKFQIQTWNL